MAINNLYCKYRYPTNGVDLPVVIMIHGWNGSGADYSNEHMDALAGSDLFMLSVGMRGRDNASGVKDYSGREIHDIYDALLHVRNLFPGIVSTEKAALLGFSGGGGNALAAACKHPDTWNVVIDFYGISDYGRHASNSFWFTGWVGYRADMTTGIGGTRDAVPERYYARDATAAIPNYSGGELVLFHDTADTVVPPVHSSRIVAALDAAAMTNYTYHLSTVGDPVRWSHGLDGDLQNLLAGQGLWKPVVLSTDAWTIPQAGMLTVIGYIVTKRFSVWLNEGVDAVASVTYDTVAGTYTVTPLTSSPIEVVIRQGGLTVTATIDDETLLTVT